jgi:hypothetical protein
MILGEQPMTDINDRAQAGMGNPDWQQNWTLDGLQFTGKS